MIWILRSIMFLLALPLWAQSEVAYMEAGNRNRAPESSGLTDIIRLPLQRIGGMLLIEAKVDGKLGQFILDTGAPGLIINEPPAKTDESFEGHGLHGELSVESVPIARFELGALVRKNITAFRLDMQHLNEAMGRPIAGLIGYDMLDDLELYLDLEQGIIELHPGNTSVLEQRLGTPALEAPFLLRNHLTVLKMKIGRRKLRLGLDTGAEVNILNERLFSKLKSHQQGPIRGHRIRGLDQQVTEVRSVAIAGMKCGETILPALSYYFSDLSLLRQQHQLHIDGLLGYPFLQQYRVAIDYQTRVIRLWPKSL